MRGTGRHSRNARLRAVATGFVALAVAALLGACGGGDSSSETDEAKETFHVKVTEAKFPSTQQLGQTSLLHLSIRNIGDWNVPAVKVSFTIAGEAGETSPLPFGVNDSQRELAQPERPVWVLAATYPRLNGSSDPGGASTSSRKTFSVGPLKPGQTVKAVWKLSAVRAGEYDLLYDIDTGLDGGAKTKIHGGLPSDGVFATEITGRLPETEVTDSGEVVEIEKGQ